MTAINQTLTNRERRFCAGFAATGDASLAARRAGYREPDQSGEALLCRDEIAREILRLTERRSDALDRLAEVGYRRLAFGSVSDAVSLLYQSEPDLSRLGEMDLFMVSEIRRPKDGSMEIKFFDRLKALEKLERRGADCAAQGLIDAIGRASGEDSD